MILLDRPRAWRAIGFHQQEGNRRRHSKPHGDDAGSHTSRDEQMPAAFDDMTGGKALPESRRDDRRADPREAYLAAVRVAREREGDAFGNRRKDIRVVRQQKHRLGFALDRRHGGGEYRAARSTNR